MTSKEWLAAGALAALLQLATSTQAQEIDRETGLVKADGLAEIKEACTECHSAQLILQTRGKRADWLGLIRWMQESQELELLPPKIETKILDYLERNYGVAEARQRRPPLPDAMMPPALPPRE